MEQIPTNLIVQFPMRVVVALVEITERAPMHEAERLWLENFKNELAQSASEQIRRQQEGKPPAPPVPPEEK